MEDFFTILGIKAILIGGLGIIAVGFILKKLFKLAFSVAIIIALVYYGLPVLQSVMTK